MARNTELKYDRADIDDLFRPKRITDEAFNQLEKMFACRSLIRASWAKKSPVVTQTFQELKEAILLYSSRAEVEYHMLKRGKMAPNEAVADQLLKQVQNIHFRLLGDLGRFAQEEEKRVRKENIFFLMKAAVIVPSIYIAILAFSTWSLDPSDWFDKFIHHLHMLGAFITIILGYAIGIGAFALGLSSYVFLETKFIRDRYASFPKFAFGLIAIVIGLTSMLVINNGIRATFGVDPIGMISRDHGD